MKHVINWSKEDVIASLEGQTFIKVDDHMWIPKVLYRMIHGLDHYKSMPETIVSHNHSYTKTDLIHQFKGHDELFAVYVLKK